MKITRAMELIATSRIMKAQQRVEAARPYAERLTAAIADVAAATTSLGHPLLEERPDRKTALVFVVTSDRGLRDRVRDYAERIIGGGSFARELRRN